MKRLVLAALVFTGCDNGVTPRPDATPDATEAPLCPMLSASQSFSSQVGECCLESVAPLCARGRGACVVDRCVQQCTGTAARCADGSRGVLYVRPNGDVVCTCPND